MDVEIHLLGRVQRRPSTAPPVPDGGVEPPPGRRAGEAPRPGARPAAAPGAGDRRAVAGRRVDEAAPRLHKAAHYARRALRRPSTERRAARRLVLPVPGRAGVGRRRPVRAAALGALAAAMTGAGRRGARRGTAGPLLPDDLYEPWTRGPRGRLRPAAPRAAPLAGPVGGAAAASTRPTRRRTCAWSASTRRAGDARGRAAPVRAARPGPAARARHRPERRGERGARRRSRPTPEPRPRNPPVGRAGSVGRRGPGDVLRQVARRGGRAGRGSTVSSAGGRASASPPCSTWPRARARARGWRTGRGGGLGGRGRVALRAGARGAGRPVPPAPHAARRAGRPVPARRSTARWPATRLRAGAARRATSGCSSPRPSWSGWRRPGRGCCSSSTTSTRPTRPACACCTTSSRSARRERVVLVLGHRGRRSRRARAGRRGQPGRAGAIGGARPRAADARTRPAAARRPVPDSTRMRGARDLRRRRRPAVRRSLELARAARRAAPARSAAVLASRRTLARPSSGWRCSAARSAPTSSSPCRGCRRTRPTAASTTALAALVGGAGRGRVPVPASARARGTARPAMPAAPRRALHRGVAERAGRAAVPPRAGSRHHFLAAGDPAPAVPVRRCGPSRPAGALGAYRDALSLVDAVRRPRGGRATWPHRWPCAATCSWRSATPTAIAAYREAVAVTGRDRAPARAGPAGPRGQLRRRPEPPARALDGLELEGDAADGADPAGPGQPRLLHRRPRTRAVRGRDRRPRPARAPTTRWQLSTWSGCRG